MGRRPWLWLLVLLLPGATEAGVELLFYCGRYQDGLLRKTLRGRGGAAISL